MSEQQPPSIDNPYATGQASSGQLVGGKPDNYLVWAILATLCCCVPTGIAAIVFAAQVDGKWATGDYAGARDSSEKAKLWSLISLGLGLAVGVVYFGLGFLGGLQ